VGLGMALASRFKKGNHFIFVLTSDGEHNEGSIWEAAMAAAHYRLGNLINVIDRNGMQIGGETKEQIGLEPLANKYKTFGWQVLLVNGHDYRELLRAFCQAKESHLKPTVIIAKTVRGKGVSFMEQEKRYHACTLTKGEYGRAMRELG